MFNKVRKNIIKLEKKDRAEIEDEMLEKFFKHTLKPKPRWCPIKLWHWGAGIFLNLK